MTMERDSLSAKEIALLLKISVATVNYYTNIGLFHSEDRKGNKRLYGKARILSDFAKIKALRSQGYSLKLISSQLQGEK